MKQVPSSFLLLGTKFLAGKMYCLADNTYLHTSVPSSFSKPINVIRFRFNLFSLYGSMFFTKRTKKSYLS
ncbi:hypothetical protein AB205_0041980 [Aquarana catesbeiana]|uniref:Uncharacterized protein n=1 Tax=Aquarana catesbeiana TaxID=8400 RepID=A0A2G9RVT6_AQUCT|nr:hypothetical protein AB205_0041980 [Aquarana catesbeiana]